MAAEKQSIKRFCTKSLPSDIEIEVDDMIFHLHKFPLISKSKKLHRLITEQEQEQEQAQEENVYTYIRLENFPGGSETFEIVVKICYGVNVNLSASTAIPLRCAAAELEMTEEYSPENLVSYTEWFLTKFVFNSIRESIKALKSCDESVSLSITKQCIDSIVSLIASSSSDPSLGWPFNNNDGPNFAGDTNRKRQSNDSKSDLWIEDLTDLSFPIFRRVILAMKSRDLSNDIVERSLIRYAKKHIPRISSSSSTIAYENQQRDLLETIISDLPLEESSATATTTTTRSLFGLLRSAIIINTSKRSKTLLERRIGSNLEKAKLDDLLVPSYSYLNETLYDVDLVKRLLDHFLENDGVSSRSLTVVGKLIDGVLGEISSDGNLKPEKFYDLAISLPDQARLYDDGLYRAIDIYLKAHSCLPEIEKEKICSVMDCRKLTLEGCTHAAQNERLPLQTVVQVLFFEQLHPRREISRTLLTEVTAGEGHVDFGRWKKTVKENQVIRMYMDTMRTRLYRLEKECLRMKKVIAKMDEENLLVATNNRQRKWSMIKKFGCKFKTYVCDSQYQTTTMVDRRSSRRYIVNKSESSSAS